MIEGGKERDRFYKREDMGGEETISLVKGERIVYSVLTAWLRGEEIMSLNNNFLF